MEKLNHKSLIKRAEKWLLNSKGCGFCLKELASFGGYGEIPDVIGFKWGQSFLIECKASRADFLSDKKKNFRFYNERGMGDYRFYMCQPGIIREKDLSPGWGLLYVCGKIVRRIKAPTFLKKSSKSEIVLLTSALRRVHKRKDLEKIYEPMEMVS